MRFKHISLDEQIHYYSTETGEAGERRVERMIAGVPTDQCDSSVEMGSKASRIRTRPKRFRSEKEDEAHADTEGNCNYDPPK